MIPLMTSRFRPGFTPRRLFGIAASIDASCSSVSQNRLDIVASSIGKLRIEPYGVRSTRNWVSSLSGSGAGRAPHQECGIAAVGAATDVIGRRHDGGASSIARAALRSAVSKPSVNRS
jgi:hypothetical protein